MTLSLYQDNLLRLGPFGVKFDDVQTLCNYHHFYRFSASTIRAFRARFPEQPIKIGKYIYVIETSAAGPRISDGRVARLIQVSVVNPGDSQIVETGTAAVKRVWKGLVRQAIDLERAMVEGGQI